MKTSNYVNSNGRLPEDRFWYRCKRVDFHADTATWELSQAGRYGFQEAYERAPHCQLVAAGNDEQLRVFVKAWGPPRAGLDAWSGSDPIASYRYERDRLVLKVKLLAAVAQPERQRSVLLELAGFSGRDIGFEILLKGLRTVFSSPGEVPFGADPHIQTWLEGATQNDMQMATEYLVCNLPLIRSGPNFTVVREGRRRGVHASLGLDSLGEALEWMVWQDAVYGRLFQFCERFRCQKLFRPDSRHAMKYCNERCAHLEAARKYAERKRNEEAANGT
jgi:hypothetical protein